MKPHSRIGVDLKFISNGDWEFMERILTNATINLVPINYNLIDKIWDDEIRPNYPAYKAYVWPLEYAGKYNNIDTV